MFKLIIGIVALVLWGDITSAEARKRSVHGVMACSDKFIAIVRLMDRDNNANDVMRTQLDCQLTTEYSYGGMVKHYSLEGVAYDGGSEAGIEDYYIDIVHDCHVPVGRKKRTGKLFLHLNATEYSPRKYYIDPINLDDMPGRLEAYGNHGDEKC